MNAEYFSRVAKRRVTGKHSLRYWDSTDGLYTEKEHAKEMTQYLRDCKATGEWAELCKFTHCTVQVFIGEGYLWAECPKTVDGLAFMLLAQSAGEVPKGHIEGILKHVLSSIKKGEDSTRENALLLLHSFVGGANELAVLMLLENDTFNVLVRLMNCSKRQIRTVSASICHSLYRHRSDAQDKFFLVNGASKLLQLIVWNSDEEEALKELLEQLEGLILDEKERPRRESCLQLQQLMTFDILRDLILLQKSDSVKQRLSYLMKIFGSTF